MFAGWEVETWGPLRVYGSLYESSRHDEMKPMNSSTVDISFSDKLQEQLDQVAREESRSRSELIREAV